MHIREDLELDVRNSNAFVNLILCHLQTGLLLSSRSWLMSWTFLKNPLLKVKRFQCEDPTSVHNLRKSSLGWSQGIIVVSLLCYYAFPWYMCFPLSLSEIRHIYIFNQFERVGSASPQIKKNPMCWLLIHHANSPDIFALTVLYFSLYLSIQPL
jgi:hypothetical protein